jgi:hypothetical protein
VLFDFSRRRIETDDVYKHRYSDGYVIVRALADGEHGVVRVAGILPSRPGEFVRSSTPLIRRIKRGTFLLDYTFVMKLK